MDKDLLKKVLITIVLLVALGYAGNMYVLKPKKEHIVRLDREIKSVTLRIEKGRRALRREKALSREIAELEAKLETMRAVLPTKEEIPGLIREVSRLGYYNRINYALFQPGKEVVKADQGYAILAIKLEFKAFYPQLVSLLSGISKMERLVKPVTLEVGYVSRGRKVIPENPRLMVKCTLETYRYMPLQKRKGKEGGEK